MQTPCVIKWKFGWAFFSIKDLQSYKKSIDTLYGLSRPRRMLRSYKINETIMIRLENRERRTTSDSAKTKVKFHLSVNSQVLNVSFVEQPNILTTYPQYKHLKPTSIFTTFELINPLHDVPELNKILWSSDLELQKKRVGREISRLVKFCVKFTSRSSFSSHQKKVKCTSQKKIICHVLSKLS